MDSIIIKVAGKLELKEEVVERVVRSQFDFIANTIREGKGESVHLHYLFKIGVKPTVLERLRASEDVEE